MTARGIPLLFVLVYALASLWWIGILRMPLESSVVAIGITGIAVTLALTGILFCVPLLILHDTKSDDMRSMLTAGVVFWGLIAALWLFHPGHFLLQLLWCVAAIAILVAAWRQHAPRMAIGRRPLLILCAAAIGFAASHQAFLLATGYAHPLGVDAAMVGGLHKDTLYHAMLAQMLELNGTVATAYDGVVPTAYHVLSHRFIASIAGLGDLVMPNAYTLFLPVMGVPFLWGYLLMADARLRQVEINPQDAMIRAVYLIAVASLVALIGSRSFLVSESYTFSLWPFFWAIFVMSAWQVANRTETAIGLVFLAVLVLLASYAKISTGAVLACGVAVFLFWMADRKVFGAALGFLVGLVPFLAVAILTPTVVETGSDKKFELFHTAFRYPEMTLVHALVGGYGVWLVLTRLPSDKPRAALALALGTIILSGFGASQIVRHEAGSSFYFANPGIWATLCIWSMLAGAPKFMTTAGRLRAGRVVILLCMVLFLDDRIISAVERYGADLSASQSARLTATAAIITEVLADSTIDGVFVDPEVSDFWGGQSLCWSVPMLVPAVTGVPMLMGIPQSSDNCPATDWYNFVDYNRAVSTVKKLDNADLCAAAQERGMSNLLIVAADRSLRRSTCR